MIVDGILHLRSLPFIRKGWVRFMIMVSRGEERRGWSDDARVDIVTGGVKRGMDGLICLLLLWHV